MEFDQSLEASLKAMVISRRGEDHKQKTQQSSQSRLSFGVFKMQKSNLLARTEGSQSIGGKDSEVKGSLTILNFTGCGEDPAFVSSRKGRHHRIAS